MWWITFWDVDFRFSQLDPDNMKYMINFILFETTIVSNQ